MRHWEPYTSCHTWYFRHLHQRKIFTTHTYMHAYNQHQHRYTSISHSSWFALCYTHTTFIAAHLSYIQYMHAPHCRRNPRCICVWMSTCNWRHFRWHDGATYIWNSTSKRPNTHLSKGIIIGATIRVSDVDTSNKSLPLSWTSKSPRRMVRMLGFWWLLGVVQHMLVRVLLRIKLPCVQHMFPRLSSLFRSIRNVLHFFTNR